MIHLHLIATHPSHGDQHGDPVDPRELSIHDTRDEALRAGRRYLSEHPKAWLQLDDGKGGSVEDVKA
jgi:hypothetical protein